MSKRIEGIEIYFLSTFAEIFDNKEVATSLVGPETFNDWEVYVRKNAKSEWMQREVEEKFLKS